MGKHTEEAIMTYEILRERRAAKKRAQEKMADQVQKDLIAHCARRHDRGCKRLGRGVVQTKFIGY